MFRRIFRCCFDAADAVATAPAAEDVSDFDSVEVHRARRLVYTMCEAPGLPDKPLFCLTVNVRTWHALVDWNFDFVWFFGMLTRCHFETRMLRLDPIPLSARGVSAFEHYVQSNRQLESLDLSLKEDTFFNDNDTPYSMSATSVKKVIKSLYGNTSIRCLRMRLWPMRNFRHEVHELIRRNSTLRVLELRFKELDDDTLLHLLGAICSSKLSEIKIYWSAFLTSAGLHRLLHATKSKTSTLTGIAVETEFDVMFRGSDVLLRFLREEDPGSTSLRRLYLHDVCNGRLFISSSVSVLRAMENNSFLECLTLVVDVVDLDRCQLGETLPKMSRLKQLVLKVRGSLSDGDEDHFVEGVRGNKTLQMFVVEPPFWSVGIRDFMSDDAIMKIEFYTMRNRIDALRKDASVPASLWPSILSKETPGSAWRSKSDLHYRTRCKGYTAALPSGIFYALSYWFDHRTGVSLESIVLPSGPAAASETDDGQKATVSASPK